MSLKSTIRTSSTLVGLLVFVAGVGFPGRAVADFSITVGATNLPVGGSTSIHLFLDSDVGPVAGLGATVAYDPGQIVVTYATAEPEVLGGAGQTVPMCHHEPGRIVLAAARAGAVGYQASAPEPFGMIVLRRLVPSAVTVQLTNAFYAAAGGAVIHPVAMSNVIFGVVSTDVDGDGILDEWEFAWFGDLRTAGASTDFDRDGTSDLNEFLAGLNPRIPYLTGIPEIDTTETGNQRLVLSFLTEPNVTYHVETCESLTQPVWQPRSFILGGGGSFYRDVLVGDGAVQSIEVPLTSSAFVVVRIKVTE